MAQQSETRTRMILVVDDERDILDSLQTLIETTVEGAKVTTAASGPEALEVLATHRFDLILTDYKMPRMNGIEFLAEARKLAPKTPRIMLTAFPDLDLAISALNQERIEKFLVKPIEPETLLTTIQEVLAVVAAETAAGRDAAKALDALRRRASGRP